MCIPKNDGLERIRENRGAGWDDGGRARRGFATLSVILKEKEKKNILNRHKKSPGRNYPSTPENLEKSPQNRRGQYKKTIITT